MNNIKGSQALVCILAAYLSFLPIAQAQQGNDVISPVIKHEPLAEPLSLGEPLAISATVTDNVGVESVLLFFRTRGRNAYQRTPMRRIGTTNMYMVTLKGVRTPGLEYYVQATDVAGNILLEGYDFAPMFVAVKDPAVPAAEEAPKAPAAAAAKPPPAKTTTASAAAKKKEESGAMKWVWIGLGVLAVGALASGGSSGGGGDSDGDVVITAPAP